MQHSELLHRFFDEGLEEPLEDVLFGQMALDPELRREFISHLKFHSIIQEDVAGITTPSHVSQQLFTTLGLTPPDSPHVSPVARFRDGAGAAWLRVRHFAEAHRQHLYTALVSALATALLLLNFTRPQVELLVDESAGTGTGAPTATAPHPNEGSTTDVTPAPVDAPATDVSHAPDGGLSADPSRSPDTPPSRVITPRTDALDRRTATAIPGRPAQFAAASPAAVPAPTEPLLAASMLPPTETPAHAASDEALTAGIAPRGMEPRDEASVPVGLVPEDAGVDIAEVPVEDVPWRFTQPGPRENILSNMVFELRKIYGTSYPDVDLPHNSFTVFQDMAISAIYKTTEHHAFGFEYGRESFGREFQRAVGETGSTFSADPSMAQIYRAPSDWLGGPQRENRMLDVFGAVWKLSLPEYGMFNLVYPYLRTFVGATKLGPLGKVRAGIEMYPSNFSMLNVGVEGGMLRYSVDAQAYYTAKLNFTFGVAIGF